MKTIIVFVFFLLIGSLPAEAKALSYKTEIFRKEGKSFSVEAKYPQFNDKHLSEEKKNKVNHAIEVFVRTLYAEDLETFETSAEGYSPEWAWGVADMVYVSFKIIYARDDHISIRFEKYFYGIGAVHGVTTLHGFNYDLKDPKPIKLADLFEKESDYLKQISDYCIVDLNRRLKPEFNDSDGGAGPKEENLKEFCLTKKHLIIYFSDYQVACYASGTQEVKIPLKRLKGFSYY